jgi:hypothetical protein
MRLQYTITVIAAVIATNLIITGCSKSSSPRTQANRQKQSLDVLQKQYQAYEREIADAQKNLDELRKKYNVRDTSPDQLSETNLALASSEEPYWVAKRRLANMIDFQRVIQAKITAEKIDAQINAQAGQR